MMMSSHKGGAPLSVTRTQSSPPSASESGGSIQVNRPLVGLMLAPAGTLPSRRNVRVWPGKSGSVAPNEASKDIPEWIWKLGKGGRKPKCGGELLPCEFGSAGLNPYSISVR